MERYQCPVIFTAQQNVLLTEIDPSAKDHIERILFRSGLADSQKPEIYDLMKDHMACPALPMCGLATTEAERIPP